MKKGFTLVEILAVVVILGVISVIAYPIITNMIENSKISAFDSSKKLIIKSAKNKYATDVNSSGITTYKVLDLIKEGYISNGAKNPITGEEYSTDTKILITNNDGDINFYYIDGQTVSEKIKNTKDSTVYINNDEYLFKGNSSKNYLSFNEEIYRIIKVDKYGYIYIINDACETLNAKEEIMNTIITSFNDKFNENLKAMIEKNAGLLTKNIYDSTLLDNKTYILGQKDIWVKEDNNVYTIDAVTGTKSDVKNACIKNVLILKNYLVVDTGDGTQFSPYIVNIQNY